MVLKALRPKEALAHSPTRIPNPSTASPLFRILPPFSVYEPHCQHPFELHASSVPCCTPLLVGRWHVGIRGARCFQVSLSIERHLVTANHQSFGRYSLDNWFRGDGYVVRRESPLLRLCGGGWEFINDLEPI